MATRTAPQPIAHMSEADFLARIHEKPSLEYIDGDVYRKPVAGDRHGNLVWRLGHRLASYADEHGGTGGPEIHVNFSEAFHRIYRVPDMSFWAPGKPKGATDIPLPPTLAVEVRSPSQSMDELREKCRFMLASGVDLCWLVDPQSRTIEVFEDEAARVLRAGDTLASEHLPDFELALDDLFAVLGP